MAYEQILSENVDYEEFVNGIKKKTLKINFTIKDINVYGLCSRKEKKYLAVITAISSLLPPILIIIFTIFYSDWLLLFGLLLYWIAAIVSHFNLMKRIGSYLFTSILSNGFIGIIALYFIFKLFIKKFDLHNYFTFFSMTFIFTLLLTEIEKKITKQRLIKLLIAEPYKYYENRDKIEIYEIFNNI